ncbi:hypothetical protein [Streptomyces sp. NPDC048357]|uniref:hypothetical protein n=1 Tax=Streptomyces sp. NPDC048357 TaxID=3154719 RepID=UPI00343E96E4
MSVPLMGVLLLLSVAMAGAGIATVVLLLRNPPLRLPTFCAALVPVCASSAAAVYCYGWFSVTMGGPFPELCEDLNAAGAALAGMKQEYWPLRSACVYADGSTVEYVSMSINVLVCVLTSLAVVLTAAAGLGRRWYRRTPPAGAGRAVTHRPGAVS